MNKIQPLLISTESIINKRKILFSLILFLILFSNASLRNLKYIQEYTVISLLVCFVAYFYGVVQPTRIVRTVFNSFNIWLLSLFGIYFLYGILLKGYGFFNTDYFLFMLAMTMVSMMFFYDLPYKDAMKIFINVSIITSLAVALYIVVNEWSLITTGSVRIGESGSSNVNVVATYLGLMSIPSAYKIIYENKYKYVFVYGLVILVMLLTGSKKALIYIIFGILFLLLFKYRFKLHKYIISFLFLVLLIVLILNNEYLYNVIGFRILSFFSELGVDIEGIGNSRSTFLRLSMYEMAFDAFFNNPIFGGGWHFFSYYSNLGTYSHSNFMELLVNYGIVGFLIYYSMYLIVIIRLITILKVDNYAKILMTWLIIILIVDATVVSFSILVLNYIIVALSYRYTKGAFEKMGIY